MARQYIIGGSPVSFYVNETSTTEIAFFGGYVDETAGGTFAMTAAIVTTQIGPITVYVNCAKTSTIFYVDPLAVLS